MTGELAFPLKEGLMTRKIILIGVIVLSLFGLIYLSFGPRGKPPVPALPTGTAAAATGSGGNSNDQPQAPDFQLAELRGEYFKLSGLRGKVVVVNFWATSCPPCIMEMPTFEKLAEIMKGKPFQILTISSDPRDVLEHAARRLGIKVPILLDPNGKVAASYGVYYTPMTFIIDMDGKVDQRLMGAANWADKTVVDYINRLIAQGQEKK